MERWNFGIAGLTEHIIPCLPAGRHYSSIPNFQLDLIGGLYGIRVQIS